jgi:hypothetical protein
VPARVVGNARRTPTGARRVELAERMMTELNELLMMRGHDVTPVAGDVRRGFTIRVNDQTSQVLFTERLNSSFSPPSADGETVVLTLDISGAVPEGCSVIDLIDRRVYGSGEAVLDSVREFCRKRGIRFEPGPWRYRGGLI